MIWCVYYIQPIAYSWLFDYHVIISLIFLLIFQFTVSEINFIDCDFVFSFVPAFVINPPISIFISSVNSTNNIDNKSFIKTGGDEERKKGSG